MAFDSQAELVGIKPGMRLRSLSDPTEKGVIWDLPDNVTFVRAMDAIRSTRSYDVKLSFDKEPSITREMVEYAKALAAGEEEEDEEELPP